VLKVQRSTSLEEIVLTIDADGLLDVLRHPKSNTSESTSGFRHRI